MMKKNPNLRVNGGYRKSLWTVTSAMRLEDTCSLEESNNLDSVLKSRDITLPTMVRTVKAVVLPVVRYRCESWAKKGWELKSWCFQIVVLEKPLESPLDCKEIKPKEVKQISPEYSLKGLMVKLKLWYFGHLMQRANSLERTPMLGKIEGKRRRGGGRGRMLR